METTGIGVRNGGVPTRVVLMELRPSMLHRVNLLLLVLISSPAVAADAPAPVVKEGTFSFVAVGSGTLNKLQLGEDRAQVSYEKLGGATSPTGEGLFHDASIRCVGGFHLLNGSFDDDSGACVVTRPDGDQVFYVYRGAGTPHVGTKGTFTLVGGTGKMKGITGGGDLTGLTLRHAKEGTAQGVTRGGGTFKLP
jgi:hypothetical protein